MKQIWVPLALEFREGPDGEMHPVAVSIVERSADPYAGYYQRLEERTETPMRHVHLTRPRRDRGKPIRGADLRVWDVATRSYLKDVQSFTIEFAVDSKEMIAELVRIDFARLPGPVAVGNGVPQYSERVVVDEVHL